MATGESGWATKNGEPIGAWIFKSNPDVYDVFSAFEQFGEMSSWAVQRNYRCDLFRKGPTRSVVGDCRQGAPGRAWVLRLR